MRRLIITITVSLLLSACASSTRVVTPAGASIDGRHGYSGIEIVNHGTEAPEHFLDAVESYLSRMLGERALIDEEALHRVQVNVIDYRMRSGFSRAMFGVFAGKDGIDSEVTVVDTETGRELARSTVTSYNVMAVGDMDDIARMHAEEIARFLSGEGS